MDDLNNSQQLPQHFYQQPGTSKTQPSSSHHVTFAMPEYYPPAQGLSQPNAGPIRRRRYSAAKIQPTRIKKVMQSDEEIGRMVASVPVAIGRAMEHFAEKFLLASAAITQSSSCRTLTPSHMKMAMATNPHFRFLENVFREVPAPGFHRPTDLAVNPPYNQLDETCMQYQMMSPITTPTSLTSPMEQGMSPVPSSPMAVSPMMAGNGMPFMPMQPSSMMSTTSNPMTINGNERESKPVGEPTVQEKPKRGRPRKIRKEEKCIDEELCREVSDNIEKEDKDRELMPPPSLPIGVISRSRTKQVA